MASPPQDNENNMSNIFMTNLNIPSIEAKDETTTQTETTKQGLCAKNPVSYKLPAGNLKDIPVEELLGSVTTFNNAQGGTEQALRTSARVIKKLQQDSLVSVNSDKDKKDVKIDEKLENKPKPKLPKASWSLIEKNLFFEALNEYGKDFESVTQYISSKMKRRGVSDNLIKTREQVRHFYYRNWNKISKFISFNTEIKKVAQELYLLINYGEMRKKIFLINEKTALKLGELIYRGSVPLRMKGKTFRIKTPMCKALRKLNEMEEWQEELKLPTRVLVILQPSNVEAWHRVQSVAHNPRVTAMIPIQRRLSNLLSILNERWKTYDTKLLQKLVDIDECVISNKSLSSQELLHFGPKAGVHINKPIINLSEYITSNRICLNSYEERLGITEKSETIFARTIQNFKGGGAKKGTKRQRSDSGGDKKNLDTNDISNKKAKIENESLEDKANDGFDVISQTMQKDQNLSQLELSKDLQVAPGIKLDTVVKDECLETTEIKVETNVILNQMDMKIEKIFSNQKENIAEKNVAIANQMEAGIDKTSLLSNQKDIKVDKNIPITNQKAEVKSKIKDRVKVIRKRQRIINNKSLDKETETKIQDIFKYGWTIEDATDVTFGDLYLMFGSNSKLQLEYWWDSVSKPAIDETDSVLKTMKDDIQLKDSTQGELKEQEKSSKDQNENFPRKTNDTIISDMHTLLPHKTDIQKNLNVASSEPEQIVKTTELTRRLKQLLFCIQTNEKAKSTCLCGHVCNNKSNQNLLNTDFNNEYQTTNNAMQRSILPIVRNNTMFRQPFPVTSQAVEDFEKQINSIMKTKPRWNNRQNRFIGNKQVVQRMLPLVPNSSTSNFSNYSHSNLGHQSRIATRQLNFGADAAQNFPKKIESKVVEEVKKPILPANPFAKSNIRHSSLIKNKTLNKQVSCTVVKENYKTAETILNESKIVEKSVTKEVISELIDDISIGSSTIAEAKASMIRNDNLDEILNSSPTPEPFNTSCVLNTPENTWFNSELHDFSLSSFLGHLESPIKPQGTSSEDAKICQDVDVNMQSLLNENSEDYMAKFAALAARISNENSNK